MKPGAGNSKELKAIAKGGVVVTLGRLAGKLLRFLLVVLIVRLITKADFGLISLAYVILSVAATLASFGLVTGTPRFIAKCRAEMSDPRSVIGKVIASAGLFVLGSGLVVISLLYVLAGPLAQSFETPGLHAVLQVFAFLALPLVGIQFLSGVFRGLERALPRFIFEDVLIYVVRLGLIAPLFALDERFHGVLWAYVLSSWITFVLAAIYAARALRRFAPFRPDLKLFSDLMRFSIPLMGVSVILQSTSWLGTLLLGLWAGPADVAGFTVAVRLAEVLAIGIMAVSFIFMPIATRAWARKDVQGLAHLYASTTKWASAFSLPVLLFFAFDADYLLAVFFSPEYADSAVMLQVLAGGYFVHTVLGLNGSTLLASGESRQVFVGSALYGGTAAGLALALTGALGGLGVAIALAAGLTVCNFYLSLTLYRRHGIAPLDKGNFRPILLLTVLGAACAYLLVPVAGGAGLAHAALFALLYLIAFFVLWATSSLDDTDMDLLGGLEKRFTGRTRLVNRLRRGDR